MWIIAIIVLVALASAGGGAPKSPSGFRASDGCASVYVDDIAAAAAHTVGVMQAHGWMGPATTRAEVEARMLAILRAALPSCEGVVPAAFSDIPGAAGQAWDSMLDAWAQAQGLEGAGADSGIGIFAIAVAGAPPIVGGVVGNVEGFGGSDPPPNAGGSWLPDGD